MLTNVRTSTWVREYLETTPPDAWGADETTEIDLVPAGALAPVETLPPLEPIPGLGGLTLFD